MGTFDNYLDSISDSVSDSHSSRYSSSDSISDNYSDNCIDGFGSTMYHMETHLEQFSTPLTESWNLLPSDEFPYDRNVQDIETALYLSLNERQSDNSKSPYVDLEKEVEVEGRRDCIFGVPGTPSKMMTDHSLITDSHMDHPSFMHLKGQGMEAVLDGNHVGQLFFNDSVGVPNELIVEQSVEVGNEDPHAEIILVANTIKQEDIIEGGEVIVASSVDNEVIIDDHMDSHLDTDHFVIGSSIDIGSDQMDDPGFDDTKLIIDTDQYAIEDDAPCMTYECGECGCLYQTRALLKKHVRSQHPKYQKNKAKKTSVKERTSGVKRYPCPSCSYASQRRDKLDKHMEKHVLLDGVHPCGKKRHKPEALPQRHRHNAEEYRCPHCPYSCTVYRALKKHQKVHLADNETFTLKLSCKICGKDRPTETEMQRHSKKHKRGDHFQCDLCNFTSVQLKKIIQHRRMHTGEKPHLCPHCSYRSARRDNLRSHVRRMHKRPNMYIDTFNPNEESTAVVLY